MESNNYVLYSKYIQGK